MRRSRDDGALARENRGPAYSRGAARSRVTPEAPRLPAPFVAKVVEPIRLPPRAERERLLAEAGYNVFALPSRAVFIDLLTDSGTGALSARQLAAMMTGDEAYAGSRSFAELEATVRDLLGFPFVIPAHQGRGAEHVLNATIARPGDVVPGNAHFDTTKAHIQAVGARAIDCTIPESRDPRSRHPFKGNVDLAALEAALDAHKGRVPYVLVTLTCNTVGGQPVSMENLADVASAARACDVPLFLDIARYAENAFLVQEREGRELGRSVAEIARAAMDLADGALMSAKKDGLSPIGGFLAVRDRALFERLAPAAVLYEGFLTYGGLAGHDLAAIAVGLREALDEDYLRHRVGQVRYLAEKLLAKGIPVLEPPGGHSVNLLADEFFPHLPREALPAQSLVAEIYLEGGVRAVEVGTVLAGAGERAPLELVRLAIPRRVYGIDHLDYVADVVARVWERRHAVTGLAFERETPVLRHFTSRFAPLPAPAPLDARETAGRALDARRSTRGTLMQDPAGGNAHG